MNRHCGSTMLLVVLLMSIVLVLCTRMWQTTAYVIDIAVKKQEAVQQQCALEGILNCGIAACRANVETVLHTIHKQGGRVTVPLRSYQLSVPQLKNYTPTITFTKKGNAALELVAALRDGERMVRQKSCVVQH